MKKYFLQESYSCILIEADETGTGETPMFSAKDLEGDDWAGKFKNAKTPEKSELL